jgi:hypothetical protein
MARTKRSSDVLNKATMRLTGLKTIGEPLDFGNGLNLAEYEARFQALQSQLILYNEMLDSIDGVATQVKAMEQELRGYSERMLTGVLTRYGKESPQYRQAGGKLRKAPSKRSTTTPTVTPMLETGLSGTIDRPTTMNPAMAAMN